MPQAPTPQTPTLLKALVDARRWRFVEFQGHFDRKATEILRRGARNPTIGERNFRRWTGGQLRGLPGPDVCQVLEALFETPAKALFEPPVSCEGGLIHTPLDLEAEIAMTAHHAQEDATTTAATSLSDLSIEQLYEDMGEAARGYTTSLSPAEVWTTTSRVRDQAEELRGRTHVPAQQQELLLLAGQASALLATCAFDLGQVAPAKRLARTAALYGETARCEPLQAFAAGVLAYVAYFAGTPSEAVRQAQRGRAYHGLGDTAERRLRSIEARAHAYLGDRDSALRIALLSETAGEGTTDLLHDEIGGEFGFSNERLAMSNASTALLVGDGERAEDCASRALKLLHRRPQPEQSAAVLAGASADLALARLLRDEVEGAAEALTPMWTVPASQRLSGLLHRLARIRQVLASPRYQEAASTGDLAERVEHFALMASAQPLTVPTGPLALEP